MNIQNKVQSSSKYVADGEQMCIKRVQTDAYGHAVVIPTIELEGRITLSHESFERFVTECRARLNEPLHCLNSNCTRPYHEPESCDPGTPEDEQ